MVGCVLLLKLFLWQGGKNMKSEKWVKGNYPFWI